MTFRSDVQGTLKSSLELGSSATEPIITLAKSPSQVSSFQLTLPPSSGETRKFLLATSPGILNFSFLLPGDIPNLDANKITSGTLPINRGGTGQATVTGAINALLPSQLGNENKALLTNGTNVFWGTVATSGSTPGGNNTNIQFNDSGDLGGSDNFNWDNITNTFQIKQAANQSSNLFEILDNSDDLLAYIDQDGAFNAYQINFKATATQSLTASSAISPNASAVDISSSGNITLNATPTIDGGTEGQWLIINNTGDYKITLQSESQLTSSGLRLFNKTIPIPAKTPLLLQYRNSKWEQRAWGSTIANIAGIPVSFDSPTDGQAPVYNALLDMYVPSSVGSGGGGYSVIKYSLVTDSKNPGVHGGSPAGGAWRQRDLNTLALDQTSAISVSSNQFNLPAGNYWIRTISIVRDLQETANRLESTDSTIIIEGLNCRAVLTSSLCSISIGKLALSTTKSFKLNQYVTLSNSDTFGYALNQSGRNEQYANIEILQYNSSNPPYQFALLKDSKSQNTAGGTGASNGWRLRTVNTIVEDDIGVSLSNNQITLPAGTYWVRIFCCGNETDPTTLRFISTDSTIIADSLNQKFNNNGVTSPIVFLHRVTLATTKTFELQQYITFGGSNNFGQVSNISGRNEYYTLVEICKVVDPNRKRSLLRDIKSQGSNGGTGASGGWRVRDCNELTINDIGLSLSNNQITFPSGSYMVRIYATNRELQGDALRLRATDDTIIIDGLTGKSHYESVFIDVLTGYLDLAASKTFEIQQYVSAGGYTNNFGYALNLSGRPECYLLMEVEKL